MPRLEAFQTHFETIISSFAPAPFINIIPGTIRVAYGAIQLTCAVAVGIFAGLRACFSSRSAELAKYAFTVQTPHALANIGIGALEAIPLVSSFVFFVRALKNSDGHCNLRGVLLYPYPDGPEEKYFYEPNF